MSSRRRPYALRVRDDRRDRAAGTLQVVGDAGFHREQLLDGHRRERRILRRELGEAFLHAVVERQFLFAHELEHDGGGEGVGHAPDPQRVTDRGRRCPGHRFAVRLGEEPLVGIPHTDVERGRLACERSERGLRGGVHLFCVGRAHVLGGGPDAERDRGRESSSSPPPHAPASSDNPTASATSVISPRRLRPRCFPGHRMQITAWWPRHSDQARSGTLRSVTPACTPCGSPSSTNTAPFTSVHAVAASIAGRSGRHRAGKSCTYSGSGSAERVEVDARSRRRTRPARARRGRATPNRSAVSDVRRRMRVLDRELLAVADPVQRGTRSGSDASMIRPTCAPESPRPTSMRGWSSISSTASMRWLRNGKLKSARPLRLARDPHERLGDRLAARVAACAASESAGSAE